MSRNDRQRAELLELCRSGSIARAIDLAFQHFADFGPDHHLLEQLRAALNRSEPSPSIRHRFADLCAAGAQTNNNHDTTGDVQ
jgi:hypothetical protein